MNLPYDVVDTVLNPSDSQPQQTSMSLKRLCLRPKEFPCPGLFPPAAHHSPMSKVVVQGGDLLAEKLLSLRQENFLSLHSTG
jgi:hypothetical protein